MAHRLGLRLDGPGHKDLEESGYHAHWTMDELLKRGLLTNSGAGHFWIPQHSQWAMIRPLQFDPNWYKSSDLSDFLMDKTFWTFSSGFGATPALDWPPHDTATQTFSADQAMVISVPASIGTPAFSADLSTLADVCGIEFPSGTEVVAASASVPGAITPFLQWLQYPDPEDLLIFGFGDMALVTTQRQMWLCKTDALTSTTATGWTLLGTHQQFVNAVVGLVQTQIFPVSVRPEFRPLLVYPVGWNQLYLQQSPSSEPWIVTTRDPDPSDWKEGGSPSQIHTGKWWIAAAPSSRAIVQIQQVGYYEFARNIELEVGDVENGETPETGLSEGREWFNLTQEYTPLADPELHADAIISSIEGGLPFTPGGSSLEAIAADGEAITVEMVRADYNIWASDGEQHRGAFAITLYASGTPVGLLRKISPQIREIFLKFPVVLTDGPNTDVLLTDVDFKPNWEVETHLRDTDSKALKFSLTDTGAEILRTQGLDLRHDYAVELCEDTDDNGTYVTVRAAGWAVNPPDVSELKHADNNPDTPIDDSAVNAKGLLQRADRPWFLTGYITDPANAGKLTHTAAVAEALLQSGFDTADTNKVQIADPEEDGLDPVLPGTPAEQMGKAGEASSSPYAADWDETMLEYCKRVKDEWTGTWVLYEDLPGTVIYREDWIQFKIERGEDDPEAALLLTPVATFYRTSANAVSAGQDPRQFMLAVSDRITRRVQANRIRVIPADPSLPQYFARDVASKATPTAENYVGRWITKVRHPAMAVNDRACRRITIRALRQLRRKPKERVWRVLMPPWEIGIQPTPEGVDVGSIVTLDGIGDFQIIHMTVKGLGPDVIETTFTGEQLPGLTPVLDI